MRRMDNSTTSLIAARLTRAIVEHRLQPGTKLAEQSWPTTLACRARWCARRCSSCRKTGWSGWSPRGAPLYRPSADEARQSVCRAPHARTEMVRAFMRQVTPKLRALHHTANVAREKRSRRYQGDAPARTELLGDFPHVRMAEADGQPGAGADAGRSDLALLAHHLMYQIASAAANSHEKRPDRQGPGRQDEERAVTAHAGTFAHVEEKSDV